jgi:hypothetical protein
MVGTPPTGKTGERGAPGSSASGSCAGTGSPTKPFGMLVTVNRLPACPEPVHTLRKRLTRNKRGLVTKVRRASRGLAFGLALAVRPAGLAEAPGSTARRRRVPRSNAASLGGAGGISGFGGEGGGLVVVLAGDQAVVQAAERSTEQVALGGSVPVADLLAAVVLPLPDICIAALRLRRCWPYPGCLAIQWSPRSLAGQQRQSRSWTRLMSRNFITDYPALSSASGLSRNCVGQRPTTVEEIVAMTAAEKRLIYDFEIYEVCRQLAMLRHLAYS